jgi:hypothetical protein
MDSTLKQSGNTAAVRSSSRGLCRLLERFFADCDPKRAEKCLPIPQSLLKTVPITITVGDWGVALDDVFEVWFDGNPVLAPGIPVRNLSTTFDTYAGSHNVHLVGIVVPDNTGTYELSFSSNVAVLSGPALQGSDLSAGETFSFYVMVT